MVGILSAGIDDDINAENDPEISSQNDNLDDENDIIGVPISDDAVTHSGTGNYTNTNRLRGGGHGQSAMDYMDRTGIEYEVTKTYPNGVRTGRVIDHKYKIKRSSPNQSWFPSNWNEKDINEAIKYISVNGKENGIFLETNYRGIKMLAIKTHGKIATIFPDSHQ